MTAIMGRMATYSGKRVKWNAALHSNTQLADTDALQTLDDTAPVMPSKNGKYAIAIPGNHTSTS